MLTKIKIKIENIRTSKSGSFYEVKLNNEQNHIVYVGPTRIEIEKSCIYVLIEKEKIYQIYQHTDGITRRYNKYKKIEGTRLIEILEKFNQEKGVK